MSARRRLAVFDVDGTLVDSQEAILAAMGAAFASAGLALPPRAEVLSIVGLSLPLALARLAPDQPEATVASMVDAYREDFQAQRRGGGGESNAPLYPGARAALDRLGAQRGVALGVATGKARRGLDHLLALHRLAPYFETLQTSDTHPSKPHPAMLEAAFGETGVAARDAVMIGDTEFDIAMGRAAGCATIGVAWGYHPVARLREAGADVILESFDALDAALDALWGRVA